MIDSVDSFDSLDSVGFFVHPAVTLLANHGLVRALTNRMHGLLRLLRGVVQESEEKLEILNEIR